MMAAMAQAELASPPDTVRLGFDIDSLSLDARLAAETTSYRLNDLLYDGLVRLDRDLLPQPALATSWEQPDATTLIFHLREGVTFHDGSVLSAEDVVYTYTTMLDPALNARNRSLYTPIAAVTAIDPLTVEFKLAEPYAPLFSYLDLGIVPQALAEGNADFGTTPVGTGPFKLEAWTRGSQINLTANPDYWGGRPAVQNIEVVIVGNGTARAQALAAGDVDLIMTPLPPAETQMLDGMGRFDHTITPAVAFTYVNFNTGDALLSDPALRAALAKLIDQPTIVDQIFGGLDLPASSILMPAFPWVVDDSIAQPGFDMQAAMAELDALGWVMGPAGIRVKDGQELALSIGTNSEDAERIQSVEYLQNVFTGAGIRTEAVIVDYPTFMQGNQGKTYQISFLSWGNLVDPDRAMFGQLRSGGNFNWGSYANPEVDAALDAGRAATTVEERASAYRAAAAVISAEVPYYVISHMQLHTFVSDKLAGFAPDPRGFLTDLAAPAQ
ncbi:hypothetical protein KvSKV_15010 (plasmid) [Ketogulonicigenium vulgare]|nr:hypothetical protein KvSKV_15010 [Ketogulonicigenium vulgare]